MAFSGKVTEVKHNVRLLEKEKMHSKIGLLLKANSKSHLLGHMNNILTNKTFNVETFEIRKAQKQQ
jgi:hypothetical protein